MFIELIGKVSGAPLVVQASQIMTFNTDTDGTGTMLILEAGITRTVKEDYATIKAAVGIQDLKAAAVAKKKK